VLSSDAVVHELYRRPDVRDAVVERVGPQALGSDDEVDRAALGVLAFSDPALLDDLERLVHPLVAAETERFRRAAELAGARVAVHENPLLFERGGRDRYDRTVLITAPDDVRRARDPERFDRRRGHQMPEQEKRALADEVYVNDGSLEALDAWVAGLLARLAG
jgi:dephospho-CoA kinase